MACPMISVQLCFIASIFFVNATPAVIIIGVIAGALIAAAVIVGIICCRHKRRLSKVFVITPTSVNATLGSTATFNCSASTGVMSWTINGSDQFGSDITTTGGRQSLSLHVPATKKYNNTHVVCAVDHLDVSHGHDSDPALLRVQGLLDAVTNLKSESLGQVIRLTWDAPFSLDITGVDPDIWYRVEITVGNSSFSTPDDINVTEFNFTMDSHNDTSSSVIYEFQVTPVNGAGNGIASAPVTGYFGGPPRGTAQDMVVTSGSANPLNVNFTITYKNIPPGEMPDRFQVHAVTVDGGNKVTYCTDDIQVTPGSDGRVFIQLNASTPTCHGSSSLEPHRRYKAVITAKNRAGGTISTGDIQFSTHEAQNCTVNDCSRSNAVNISCAFPENSGALGYLSILNFDNPSREMFFAASRDDMSNSDLNISVSGVPSNNYSVVFFDIGNSGVPPVLSDDDGGGWPYVLAAGIENVTATDPGRSGDENENLTVTTEAKVASVNGILKEIPKVSNGKVKLCVTFGSSTNGDEIVVFAHRVDDPERLSTYNLNLVETNCTSAPAPGDYFFGVFTNGGITLNEPATPPTISIDIAIVSPTPSVIPTITVVDATPFSVVPVAVTVPVPVLVTVVVVLLKIKAKKATHHDQHFENTIETTEGADAAVMRNGVPHGQCSSGSVCSVTVSVCNITVESATLS